MAVGKFRSALPVGFQGWLEGVGDMFYFVAGAGAANSEEVETGLMRHIVRPDIAICGPHHVRYLTAVDGFERILVHIRSRLYLDKSKHIAFHRDYIHLQMVHTPVALHYRPAVCHKHVAGKVFAPSASIVVLSHMSTPPECGCEQHHDCENLQTPNQHLERQYPLGSIGQNVV